MKKKSSAMVAPKRKTLSADLAQRRRHLLGNSAYLIIDVGRLLRREFDGQMAAMDLSRADWYLISHLVFFDGSTQQELADILEFSKGGIAKLIDRLERREILRRTSESLNGHSTKRVFLTERGKALALAVDDASVRTVKHSMSVLSAAQQAQLNELLHQVRSQLLTHEEAPQEVPAPAKPRARR